MPSSQAETCLSYIHPSTRFHLPIPRSASTPVCECQPTKLEPVRLGLGSVGRPADVGAADNDDEEDNLGEEPCPATALLLNVALAAALAALVLTTRGRLVAAARLSVQVLGRDRDDVVVVAKLTSLGSEADVGNVGDRRGLVQLKASLPLVLNLVLELQLELLVLEVGQAHLGGDARMSDAARRAASELGVLSVVGLVVGGLAVAVHGHDIGEHNAGAVVLVGIDKDSETLKLVRSTKHGSLLGSLAGDPHGEAIAVELVLARDLELDLNLPVCGGEGHTRVHPSRLRRAIRGQSNVPMICQPMIKVSPLSGRRGSVRVGSNDGVSSKVVPAALHVRVEVGLRGHIALAKVSICHARVRRN